MKIANPSNGHYYRQIGSPRWRTGIALIAMAGLATQLATQLASAQSVQVRALPLRITVPDSGTTVTTLTNFANIGGGASETLSVLNLPAGDTYVYSSIFGSTGTASFGTVLTNTAVNVANGTYTYDINASGGAVNDLLLTLQSGRMWTGQTNLTTDWSDPTSWVGGVLPGTGSDVLFTGLGAQTNDFISGVLTPNSIVDENFTNLSLRFSQAQKGSLFHTIQINPGVTLALTGSDGLSLLQDTVNTANGMIVTFEGSGGTLNVNNPSANVAMLQDDNTQFTLDLSRLGTFAANISRFACGDYTAYPNVTNLQAEGFGGGNPFALPAKFYMHAFLARTNYITADYVDPFNYTNSSSRTYALEIGNNPFSATSSGNTPNFSLGITNVFNLDGVLVSGFGGTTVTFNFNPALRITTNIVVGVSTNFFTNSMVAIFRNTNGVSPMSIFTVGDLANPNTNASGNTKGNVDFGSSGGSVDMLVDKFYLGRDRTNVVNSGGDDAQTTFSWGAGIVNANTMILGDQENGNALAQNYALGTMTVSNTGVLVVNNSLTLGYETASATDTSFPGSTWGQLNVNSGGTAMINTVDVGGPTKNSGEVGNIGTSTVAKPNVISLNGGTLIVSNMIADATAVTQPSVTGGIFAGMLGSLNMVNSTLELFLNGTNQGAYVFTSALTSSGSTSNNLVIGSIQNLNVPINGSTNIPLIWIQGASPSASVDIGAFTKVIMPPGFQGALIQDATNTQILDLNVSGHTPKNLKWVGSVNNNWDTTTFNWLDMNTGLQTNFINGDMTTFDDSSAITNINVTSTVQLIPNSIMVNNSVNYYTFSGSSLIGGATLTKTGTAYLEIDSSMALTIQLNNGTLVGNSSGVIGGVTVASGATFNYSGTVNGNVNCSGVGINQGTINGQLIISSGGIFTNQNILAGTFNAKSGSFIYNNASGQINYGLGSTASIATNGTFVNAGSVNGDVLSDGGTFDDMGVGSLTLNSLSVVDGGVFYPGADALGQTVINPSNLPLDTYAFPGALLLVQGSTIVFNVNNSSYSSVSSDFMSFGGSATAQTENGATLQINNIGVTPFAAGQRFTLFASSLLPNPAGTGSSTNTFPVISPSAPGPGLTWDLSQLWGNGSIGVITPPALTLTNGTFVQGTNIIVQLSWSTNYNGYPVTYRVESETEPVSKGLSVASTNWSSISGSWTNGGSITITNTPGTNCVFYRLVFP